MIEGDWVDEDSRGRGIDKCLGGLPECIGWRRSAGVGGREVDQAVIGELAVIRPVQFNHYRPTLEE